MNKALENKTNDIENNDLNLKKLNKIVKEKDKKIYELEKASIRAKEDVYKELKELKDFKAKTMYEKKEEGNRGK